MKRAIVFLGPSLPLSEARRLVRGAIFRPPARQGDVWRALEENPHAIALIDGVFESQPSVWHREILDALDAGVHVLGASSMGALRAAELHTHGMEGVGEIFERYRKGALIDDAHVALLHADAAHGYRPLTVPFVDAQHAADQALQRRVLNRAEHRALVAAAEQTFYQERRWPSLLDSVAPLLRPATRARWDAFAKKGLPSLKAEDARACLARLAALAKTPPRAQPPHARWPSSMARRRRLLDGRSRHGPRTLENEKILLALESRADAADLIAHGTRKLLLASLARALGLSAHASGASAPPELGLGADDARLHAELLALDALGLDLAPQLVADGPSQLEALAFEARTTGLWSQTVQALLSRRQPRGPR